MMLSNAKFSSTIFFYLQYKYSYSSAQLLYSPRILKAVKLFLDYQRRLDSLGKSNRRLSGLAIGVAH